MGVASSIDRTQRRVPILGVPLAVIYKYFDDQGNFLAAVLTFYAFIAIFPLLLLGSSILGFVLQGYPELEKQALDSALAQFPIIGSELGRPGGLQGSISAIVIGGLGALYGALGLGLALQNVQATAWAVPRNIRTHPVLTRVNSVVLMAVAGTVILGVAVLSAVVTETEVLGSVSSAGWFHWLVRLVTVLILGTVMTVLLRMAAAKAIEHDIARAAPGGFTIAVMWGLLQWLGAAYVARVVNTAENNEMNATFALVLGLMLLLYVGAIMGVLGIEVNVVLAEKLWPRALMTPFTDQVDLTEADRKAYAMYVQSQRHKGFETVSVRFDGRDGDSHEIVLDPRTEEIIQQRIPAAPPPPERGAPDPTEPIRQPQNPAH
ncbi:YihY/virulence factor BrkB family protein [Nocardioides bizhenqiangii]|uniref:YhjD/YihY/BrkB family envelope integrity protein n=1 Tax=Nocardioides bizhenqiangii TaxID=3095076 RepID=A0ABZ0ZSH7_9ACTN|nr:MULTISPECIES: YhjD/YihY/BrkB family envelope integrity protein [unclassified Nocardioides]MDZ5619233.1 YhjD/YihY/BrkB family envelope integrity protein [Nocardioides sp. HM23]WQQ26744.1 YhjD/YihY/BrkB family envelope integrity protein [Nocardioides sp. HM61]